MGRSGRVETGREKLSIGLRAGLQAFFLHSLAAVGVLVLVVAAITFLRPDGASRGLKLTASAMAFVVPALVALAPGRVWARRRWVRPARFVWVTGLLVLAAATVWVLDLPTGPGLCERCGAGEKLWRTFFVMEHGSGLMNGDGLLVGCWVPLATLGYSLGATLGMRR